MIVVSNTSPIINLAKIGYLDLLKRLYGRILIPDAVYAEIVVRGAGEAGSQEVQQLKWIETKTLKNHSLFTALRYQLQPGESGAIALAVEKDAGLLLLDEKQARKIAIDMGIEITGILGVLLQAKQTQLISSIQPLLDHLRNEAGFWIKDDLYERILNMAGEA